MTNYDGEKGKRLRGSMAPKTDDEVALAGTNSGETQNKQEALSGTNSGEEKTVALSGSNAVEDDTKEEPNKFEEVVEEVIEDAKEKFGELTSKNKHSK
ncbi:rRNA processing protein [Enterococcus thailandicus]|uniref:rRNA processing protein n=1 Tax=Enterococcus thailandicus TaxID=417368 RepID=UPI0022EBB64D|nr:rRNA processing protein [Enterococcus thailandicus]MDA3972597.1 rRNA processing protein [Enterococcus thailandicus]MDA3975093.1 rRNA processing protein [Enterococcus thailandicus]MDA3980057.1 rRNA processing protein [Enterococcus thailandicus]